MFFPFTDDNNNNMESDQNVPSANIGQNPTTTTNPTPNRPPISRIPRAGPSQGTLGGCSEIFWTRKSNFAICKRRQFFLVTNVKNFLILLSKKNKIFEDWGVVTTSTTPGSDRP